MAQILNLRTEKKRVKRRQAERAAAAQRLAHGRTKAEREFAKSQNQKVSSSLDQHRIDTGDRK